MGALTEAEIFDAMSENLRLAVEHCELLAVDSSKGETYQSLRTELKLIEGCCKQASAWRQDTRWLNFCPLLAKAHRSAGDWLRGYKVGHERIAFAPGHKNSLFLMLADNLRGIKALADDTRTKRTGRIGMILPEMGSAPFRETRPHRVVTPNGLIIPHGAAVH